MKGDVRLRTDAPENPTGMIGVGLDDGLELVKTGKLLLSPQALDELDLDDAAVGAAAPVKDVRLEKPAPVGCDRGLDADRGDAVLNGLSESVDADGEDAVTAGREWLPGGIGAMLSVGKPACGRARRRG